MTNYENLLNTVLIQIQKKLAAEKFRNEISQALEMAAFTR